MRYEIRVESVVDSDWSDWFEGLEVSYGDNVTVLMVPVRDQAALHGLLRRISDLSDCD